MWVSRWIPPHVRGGVIGSGWKEVYVSLFILSHPNKSLESFFFLSATKNLLKKLNEGYIKREKKSRNN